MPLLSIEFALCFIGFFILYWLFAAKVSIQNIMLLLASLAFLASWQWYFVINLLLVWCISAVAVQLIHYFHTVQNNPKAKKRTMQISIFFMVLQLFLYKYLNFSIEEYNNLVSNTHSLDPVSLILPLGVSFYTFQAISYVADVYQNKLKPLPSVVSLGILSSFTTITAGPIFRPKDAQTQWLPHQQAQPHQLENVVDNSPPSTPVRELTHARLAFALITVALFKKVVLASWLGSTWVKPIFANPLQFHSLEVLTGIYAYALQLFFDFSGYTEFVIALGLLLGFHLPQNFNAPYLAKNIREFWQRWHITLSHWIKDYLYIPLGGNRHGWLRTQINLMLAFVISGMWHGAGWNFFIWGAIHGVALVALNVFKRYQLLPNLGKRLPMLAIFITFHYVCFAWVFFHAGTLAQALNVFEALFSVSNLPSISLPVYGTLACMLVGWLLYPWLTYTVDVLELCYIKTPWWLLPMPFCFIIMLVFALAPAGLPSFIYANF